MRHVSFGRHRGADWLSRSAFPLAGPQPAYERFVLRLHDLHHPRALWICLALVRGTGPVEARCSAIYFDGVAKRTYVAEESWPLERACIDEERGGLGVGECQVLPGGSQGLVRGDGFALSWDVALQPSEGPLGLLPKAWLYAGSRLGQKSSLPVPAALVTGGRIELWHALGRHAPITRLDATGWRASLSHGWGENGLDCHAEAHAHALDGAAEGSYLHAVGGRTKLWHTFALQPQLGLLRLDGPGTTTQRFCGWPALRGPGPLQVDAGRWRLELLGAGANFVGEVRAEPGLTASVAGYGGGRLSVSALAQLEATWTPRGAAARAVRATQVDLEVLVPGTDA